MTKDIHDAEVKALKVFCDIELPEGTPFVSPERIDGLRAVAESQSTYDLSRLLTLCDELNIVSRHKCHIATVILVRSLLDHVPPIFGESKFINVANQYKGTKSFQDTAKHLENSSRKIADGLLHTPIRRMDSLPTATQVDFKQSLDVLLGEVIRLLRELCQDHSNL